MALALTADDVALRLAIAANPADDTARLAFLDYLCERADDGDERARVRAEFVRVQEEWAVLGPTAPTPDNIGRAIELTERSRDLLAANETTWRLAGACPKCGGNGRAYGGGLRAFFDCPQCWGSGDVGGLLRERDQPVTEGGVTSHVMTRDPVEWKRGHVSALPCSLADVLTRTHGNAHGEMDSVRWTVTEWARSVVKWHPVELFTLADRAPEESRWVHKERAWGWIPFNAMGDQFPESRVPESVWAQLPDAGIGENGAWKWFHTRADANAALGRAVAAVVRAAAAGAGGRA